MYTCLPILVMDTLVMVRSLPHLVPLFSLSPNFFTLAPTLHIPLAPSSVTERWCRVVKPLFHPRPPPPFLSPIAWH